MGANSETGLKWGEDCILKKQRDNILAVGFAKKSKNEENYENNETKYFEVNNEL